MVAVPTGDTESPSQAQYRKGLIDSLTYEVVPLKSLDAAIEHLPPGATVSVTCSPAKGIATTLALTEQIQGAGHRAVPHLAARMVEGPAQAEELARWIDANNIDEVFIVGGDAEPPAHYKDAYSFMADLLAAKPNLTKVGFTGYPDGHASIGDRALEEAMLAKQALVTDAGMEGWVSTQMCFDPNTIASWLAAARDKGLELPVKLGLAGVVERSKLVTMGARLGIGTSLSYLAKNRKAVRSLLTSSNYDPNTLLVPLSPVLESLNVDGIHCFTFNQVEATRQWQADNGGAS